MKNINEKNGPVAEAERIIAQSHRVNRGLIVAALIATAVLVGFNWPRAADAASRPVYHGTVTIVVSPTTKPDPYGQYLNTKLWDLKAAAKAAHIGKYRIVSTKYANEAYGDVYVRSTAKQSKVSDVYKLIDSGDIWESQVTMSDSAGAKLTKTQRQAELVKALNKATPR